MRKKRLLLFLWPLFISGCGGGGPSPPAATWVFQYSSGVFVSPYGGGGFSFDFPASDGAHYLVKGYSAPISAIRIVYEVMPTSGSPVFRYVKAADNNCSPDDFPSYMTLYIQKVNDNGLDEFGRWWAFSSRIEMKPGQGDFSISTSDSGWTSVYGKTQAQGGVSLPSLVAGAVGVTFGGGCFAGHGAYVSGGTASLKASLFSVQ